MNLFWKSVDSMCGYACVFERSTPAERLQVAVATAKAVARVKWDILLTAVEVLVWKRLLGGRVFGLQAEPVEGLAWRQVPDWRALRAVAASQDLVTPALFRATLWHYADQGEHAMYVALRDGRVVGAMVYRPDEEPGHRVLQVLPY